MLTLAANTNDDAPLTYTYLQSALSLPSPLALERLVTDAIYAHLLTGTLNPAQGIVAITSVAALRDLSPGSLTPMSATLDAWSGKCDEVLRDLEAQMNSLKDNAEKRVKNEALREEQLQRAEEVARKRVEGDVDAMDVDDNGLGQRQPAFRKKTGFGLGNKKR